MYTQQVTLTKYLNKVTIDTPEKETLVTLMLNIANVIKRISTLTENGVLFGIGDKLKEVNILLSYLRNQK